MQAERCTIIVINGFEIQDAYINELATFHDLYLSQVSKMIFIYADMLTSISFAFHTILLSDQHQALVKP